jgi:hypothetical protein
MVTEDVGLPFPFFLDSCGKELQMGQVADQAVGEDGPEAAFDELGHLFMEEVGMLGSGTMTPLFDQGVFQVPGPRW